MHSRRAFGFRKLDSACQEAGVSEPGRMLKLRRSMAARFNFEESPERRSVFLGDGRSANVVAAVSGLTDVDAITLSTSQLVNTGGLSTETGWKVIVLAALTNLIFKAGGCGTAIDSCSRGLLPLTPWRWARDTGFLAGVFIARRVNQECVFETSSLLRTDPGLSPRVGTPGRLRSNS
jgi:Domain of unknown function (DUF4010)